MILFLSNSQQMWHDIFQKFLFNQVPVVKPIYYFQFFFAALLAFAYAKPSPSAVVAGYTAPLAYAAAPVAYASPYTAYSAYSPYAYSAPLAYSAPYAAYSTYYWTQDEPLNTKLQKDINIFKKLI